MANLDEASQGTLQLRALPSTVLQEQLAQKRVQKDAGGKMIMTCQKAFEHMTRLQDTAGKLRRSTQVVYKLYK